VIPQLALANDRKGTAQRHNSEAIRASDRGEMVSDLARSYSAHPSTISRLTV
jgi:hypothetical protein